MPQPLKVDLREVRSDIDRALADAHVHPEAKAVLRDAALALNALITANKQLTMERDIAVVETTRWILRVNDLKTLMAELESPRATVDA